MMKKSFAAGLAAISGTMVVLSASPAGAYPDAAQNLTVDRQVLPGGERQQHGRSVGGGAPVGADSGDLDGRQLIADEQQQRAAGLGGELVGGLLVQQHLVGSEAGDVAQPERRGPIGVEGDEGDAGFGAAAVTVLGGDRFDDGGADAVDGETAAF